MTVLLFIVTLTRTQRPADSRNKICAKALRHNIKVLTYSLSEDFDATKQVAAFHLFAVAEVELGAESGDDNRCYQVPPLDGSIHDTDCPVYYTPD